MDDFRLDSINKKKLSEFNLEEVRGWMIDRLYQIEILIDDIIVDYYKPEKEEEFKKIVLNSSIISIGAKIKILNNIEGFENKQIKMLGELARIRNYFAHLPLNEEIKIKGNNKKNEETSFSIEVYKKLYIMNSEGKLKERDAKETILNFFKLNEDIRYYLKDYKV